MTDENTDKYIVKLKKGHANNKLIASRTGLSVEEVERRWERLRKAEEAPVPTGGKEMNQLGNTIIAQYRQTSLLLAHLIEGLAQQYNVAELDKLVAQKPAEETVAEFLLKHVIVIARFEPPAPEVLMQETEVGG